ncbi:MAG: diguanylate cyclase [Pseudanabaena sp.]|nr:MAG: diguanylate cyclase [Pseudanabaena sp.]
MVSDTECVCVVVDISDLKRTEKELQQKLAAIETAIDGIAILENDKYIYLNCSHAEMFGYANADELLGRTWQTLYSPSQLERFESEIFPVLIRDKSWTGETIATRKDGSTFDEELSLTLTDDGLLICVCHDISDRKQSEQVIAQQAQQEILLREITQRIRTSLNLQTIFDTACQEIRQLLSADRVGIFKFNMDAGCSEGEFVAEAAIAGLRSVLAQPVHDHCFGEDYAQLYLEGRFSAMDDIYNHGLKPCHIEVLAQFQIRANLIIPLFYGEKLWGLLCVHQCDRPRVWQRFEINLTQQIAIQIAIAIQQASLYEQVQVELQTRKQTELRLKQEVEESRLLAAVTERIRSTLNLPEILSTTVTAMQQVLECDRVLVYRVYADGTGAAVAEALSSSLFPPVLNIVFPEEVFPQVNYDRYVQGRVFALNDAQATPLEVLPCLAEFLAEIQVRAKLVVPIVKNDELWGLLIAHQCDLPRIWQEREINLLQKVSNQLAIAIQQASLFDQLQQELGDRQQTEQQLTERNEQLAISNEELARATRLKDEFLANMSHELRTPLNAILGMTEGLQEGVFGVVTESQVKALQTIERSGSHLLELINDILDVAKIESGQIKLEYSNVTIDSLCQSSLNFIKQQALKKRIQLHTKFPRDFPEVNVDERRIRQVLINLLSNAVKFTPDGGSISLEAIVMPIDITQNAENPDKPYQGYLRIAIRDTGIGIAEENISKLFEPFFQIDSALNRQYQGTGLGLPLVKRIIEMHGGSVTLTSEIGVGSCFMIDIPYANVRLTLPDRLTSSSSAISQSNIKDSRSSIILLVEDSEANVMTVSSYLVAKGYQIILAHNGQEALDIVQSVQPDLILMDIQMPIMDGLEATQRIRQLPSFANTPIIALTALAMPSDIDLCLTAGATSYLSKPVKLRELTNTIQRLLN